MAFENDKGRRRKADQFSDTDHETSDRKPKRRGQSPEVGHALRSAYQQAVSEEIPPEMLDLLGKLG